MAVDGIIGAPAAGVESLPVGGAARLAEMGKKPVFKGCKQGIVAHVGQIVARGAGQGHAGAEKVDFGRGVQPQLADAFAHGGGDLVFGGVVPAARRERDGSELFFDRGDDAAITPGPLDDAFFGDAVCGGAAQRAFADLDRLADRGVARVAVGVGNDKKPCACQRIGGVHLCAFATGEQPARVVARTPQRDAVGIGKRRLFGGVRQDGVGREAGEALGLGTDTVERGLPASGFEGVETQRQVRACAAQRIAVAQKCRERRGGHSSGGQHMRQTRMKRHPRQRPAVVGDAVAVQCAEIGQKRAGL